MMHKLIAYQLKENICFGFCFKKLAEALDVNIQEDVVTIQSYHKKLKDKDAKHLLPQDFLNKYKIQIVPTCEPTEIKKFDAKIVIKPYILSFISEESTGHMIFINPTKDNLYIVNSSSPEVLIDNTEAISSRKLRHLILNLLSQCFEKQNYESFQLFTLEKK